MDRNNIFAPAWIKPRVGWTYAGWIPKNPITSGPNRATEQDISYEELIRRHLQSDHGEIREVDAYPEGAACWFREQSADAPPSATAQREEIDRCR